MHRTISSVILYYRSRYNVVNNGSHLIVDGCFARGTVDIFCYLRGSTINNHRPIMRVTGEARDSIREIIGPIPCPSWQIAIVSATPLNRNLYRTAATKAM